MVAKDLAVYEPAKQTRSVLLYWRLPKEWAEVLYERVRPDFGAGSSLELFILTNGFYSRLRRPRPVNSILS